MSKSKKELQKEMAGLIKLKIDAKNALGGMESHRDFDNMSNILDYINERMDEVTKELDKISYKN